jgi:hypothetical protein
MTILTQRHVIRLLALGMLLILPAASGAQQRPPIRLDADARPAPGHTSPLSAEKELVPWINQPR